MGQGARISLVNKTPYQWRKTHAHSYQMNAWENNFPGIIEAGDVASVYVEFNQGVFNNPTDDAGEIDYTLEGTGGLCFQIQARYSNEGSLSVFFKNMATAKNKKGSTLLLGKKRKEYFSSAEALLVNFVLVGQIAHGFISLSREQKFPDWMKYIDNNKKLSEITIPGTHDTGTYMINEGLIRGLPNEVLEALVRMFGLASISIPIIAHSTRCQAIDLNDQLARGVRFLDIRLKKDGNKLEVYHGPIRLHINFDEILTICYKFLNNNKSEVIVMSVKNENKNNNPPIADMVKATITANQSSWYTGQSVPVLNSVRKKIVLLRRYQASEKLGIDATHWPDNMPFTHTNGDGVSFDIQDEYQSYLLGQLDHKFLNYVKPCLERAEKKADSSSLFINFTSGTGGVYPQTLANGYMSQFIGTNGMLFDYMALNRNSKTYGIIPMDFPESPYEGVLISQLISQNDFTLMFPVALANGSIYELHPRFAHGSCLDVWGNSPADGAEVAIATKNGGNNQKWKLEEVGDRIYYLHPQNAVDKVLDVRGSATANSSLTIIQSKNGGNNQKWKITPAWYDYFTLSPCNAPNMALEVFAANPGFGQRATIFETNNSFAQHWQFVKVG